VSRVDESGRGAGPLRRALWALALVSACGGSTPTPEPTTESTPTPAAPLAIVNGTLIDGTGAAPVADAVVVTSGDRIVGAGPRATVPVPAGARVVDVHGAAILPGFINAHVHDAFDAARLRTWAQAGVTTVRDMEIFTTGPGVLASMMALSRTTLVGTGNARLLSTGYIITVPGGYGRTYVTSPDEARQKVQELLDLGVDVIKLSLETGYAGVTSLPLLSSAEVAAIVAAAHERGRRVTAHVTQARFLQPVVEAGADEAAHMPYDPLPGELIRHMVDDGFIVVPTLTVLEAFGALSGTSGNLGRFVAAGGQVALGNDYTSVPQNGFDHFELGMPMHEITRMREAGMTPMQIVVAATRTAARACGLERDLGTLAAGKIADVLVVDGDPLNDLSALTRVRLVVHDGAMIRGGS
jgi:imidazolonepropionase-like amidohydrolase